MFEHSPNGKDMIYCRNLINPSGEGVMVPMEYTSWLIAPMEKVWFYEIIFIEVVMVKDENVMVKDKINRVSKKIGQE